MAASSRLVRSEVDALMSYLIETEIALHANPVSNRSGRISWYPFATGEFLEQRDDTSLLQYRAWLENGTYSAVLFDGALLQITYDFAASDLVAHRLVYVPCPFDLDTDLLQREPHVDVFDLYAAGPAHDVQLRGTIRFDFDAERAGDDHPAAHLTFNSPGCRIACAAPLRLGHFIEFVFRNFYPDLWLEHAYLGTFSRVPWGPATVTDAEARGLHMAWAV
jgi:hypothetical protein